MVFQDEAEQKRLEAEKELQRLQGDEARPGRVGWLLDWVGWLVMVHDDHVYV